MSSTFGTLNTAFAGLSAARQGIGVAGQNIANAGTAGYTRQRIETSPAAATAQTGLVALPAAAPGQGVNVDGIARLGNAFADNRVRTASAASGYANARAETMFALETSLREPGQDGLSADLQSFWAGWQDLANRAGDAAPTAVLLETSTALANRIGLAYTDVENLWGNARSQLDSMATELNSAASRTAELNIQIRATLNQGGSANELIDQRNLLTEAIASLAGGSVRDNADGTVDVYVGGNAIVSGDSARQVSAVGTHWMGENTQVHLEFTHRPGPIALDGGSLAGTLTLLGPAAPDHSGGVLAEAAAFYNNMATTLAAQVNAVHSAGTTPNGSTGLDFFGFTPGSPAAKGLLVIPTSVDEIATGIADAGAYDGGNADEIAQLAIAAGSPDKLWTSFVGLIGTTSRADLQHAALADMGLASATSAQQAGASVSLDEENVNLLTQQHAYQAAARVMTAVDEMLDTLINRTGLVGR